MTKLKDIYFGDSNGDTESRDPKFKNLFYKGNNKFELIYNNSNKFIVSGQKGTGKTILGRYIEVLTKEEGHCCKILHKNDVLLQKLIDLENIELNSEQYCNFFIWFLLREISKIIIGTNLRYNELGKEKIFYKLIQKYKFKKNKKKLKKFFSIRYGNNNYECKNYKSSAQLSGEYGSNLKGIIKNFKSVTGTDRDHTIKPFYKIIEPVQKWILECLKYKKVIIILDDLDEIGSSNILDQNSATIIINLIDAIKHINDLIFEEKCTNSKVILLIRSDILTVVNKYSSNLSKILSDSEVNLYWIDKHPQPEQHMLMQMILNKVKVSTKEFSELDNKKIYEELFPKVIDNKNMINYLIDYSFGRPRDIISYLNIVKDANPDESKITDLMLSNCKNTYSKKFKEELYNQLCVHTTVKYAEQMLKLLKSFGKPTFYITEIEEYFNKNKQTFPDIDDLNECITKMYKFGIIGNSWKNENYKRKKHAPKYLYSWGYRNDGDDEPKMNKAFTVHFGLRKALALK